MRKTALAIIVALAMLSPVLPASAATHTGQLVKGSGPTVYYVNSDSTRLVFLDAATYRTWYADFSQVQTISDAELASLPLGGTVAPRPGVSPIKFKSSNKVYALTSDGTLRGLANPAIAKMIYGATWSKKIIVLPDTEAAEFTVGSDVTGPYQYMWKSEMAAAPTIHDLRFQAAKASLIARGNSVTLASAVTTTTTLTIKASIVNGTDGRMNKSDKELSLSIDEKSGDTIMYDNIAKVIRPNDYTVYYGPFYGYVPSAWGGDCNQSSAESNAGYVHLNFGDHKVCTVTFTYSPEAAKLPTITVQVNVHNTNFTENSGAIPDDFIKSIGTQSIGETGISTVKSGVPYSVTPGTYKMSISSSFARNYLQTDWSGDCNADGTVTVNLGEHKVCTIEEFDRSRTDTHYATQGELVLYARVASAPTKAKDVVFAIDGKTGIKPFALNELDPRPANYGYTVYAYLPGYKVSSWEGDCLSGGTVNVNAGDLKTCVANMVLN